MRTCAALLLLLCGPNCLAQAYPEPEAAAAWRALAAGYVRQALKAQALDRDLEETVALKVLRAGDAEGRQVERFLREIKITRKISHPNVVKVFDLGTWKEHRYITMEFIDGLKPNSAEAKALDDETKDRLVDLGAAAIIRMLYKDGFFQKLSLSAAWFGNSGDPEDLGATEIETLLALPEKEFSDARRRAAEERSAETARRDRGEREYLAYVGVAPPEAEAPADASYEDAAWDYRLRVRDALGQVAGVLPTISVQER